MNPLQTLITDWGKATFPDSTLQHYAHKLAEEVDELEHNPGDAGEMADVGIILLQMAGRQGPFSIDLEALARECDEPGAILYPYTSQLFVSAHQLVRNHGYGHHVGVAWHALKKLAQEHGVDLEEAIRVNLTRTWGEPDHLGRISHIQEGA
jgi:hypothetical protein